MSSQRKKTQWFVRILRWTTYASARSYKTCVPRGFHVWKFRGHNNDDPPVGTRCQCGIVAWPDMPKVDRTLTLSAPPVEG